MRITTYSLIGFIIFLFISFTAPRFVQAATLTVCASGCDYTTVNAALSAAAEGDVVDVQGGAASPYSPSTEVWPISFPNASTTLTCTGGATINQVSAAASNFIQLSTSSTVAACAFGNVTLRTVSLGVLPVSGVRVVNNTFSTTATSTVEFVYGARDFEISGNTNINFLGLRTTSTNGLIQNNTFYGRMGMIDSAAMFTSSATSSQLRVLSNTFTSYLSGTGLSASRAVVLGGFNQVFATNTIAYAVTSPSVIDTSLLVNASGTNYIAGNFISAPSEYASCNGISISQPSNNPWVSVNAVTRNTIVLSGNCSSGKGVYLSDPGYITTPSSTLDATYNLIVNSATTTNSRYGIEVGRSSVAVPFTQTNAYNGAYRMGGVVRYATTGGSASDVSAATSLTSNPFLKTYDLSSSNDLETADFSPYLDVNGTHDIGATTASRRSSIYLDDDGTIDYAGSLGVDATSTADIAGFLRTGDTVYLAAGNYRAFTVNSSSATSSISIQGVGASTVIDAGASESGINFTNVSSSSISSLWVRNASSTASAYTATRVNFAYGGNDYADSAAPFGIPGNATIYFSDVATCVLANYTSDGSSVTSILGTGNIHFGLVDVGGIRLTFFVPNSVASNSTALQSILDNECGGIGTVDRFITNVFTYSSSEYTYQASAVSAASASLVSGVTSPPTISRTVTYYAGIKLTGSTNHIAITSVTSTNNAYGIWFATSENGYNTVSEAEFSGNTQYDLVSASNATNTFDNSSFNRTSSTVSGAGPLFIYFDARTRVTDGDGTALASVVVTGSDGLSTQTSLGSTNASGYTSFVSLPAYKITSASSATTNGGYNPYTISTVASGYSASSTSVTLSQRNQTVMFALVSSSSQTGGSTSGGSSSNSGGGGLSAGSGGGGSALGTPQTWSFSPSVPVNTVPSSSASPSVPAIVIPVAPLPADRVSTSPQLITALLTDARAFQVQLSSADSERIASFINHGTTDATVRLGEGERRAMVRDLLDTMRRSDILTQDLERLASGQIPVGRNLTQERIQLPRVRATFRTLFGHDPDFQNIQENLAWNTLMYRVRFPRDLAAEQAGIREFRAMFGRSPQDPFQWATVRVLGYVQR